MRARDAVITAQSTVPPVRRRLFAALTLAAWTGFALLMAPLVTLLLWVAGLATAYDATILRVDEVDHALLGGTVLASATLAVVLLVWADAQRRRFQGVERRRRTPDATTAEIALRLGASPEVAAVLRAGQVVSLAMDGDGAPVAARTVGLPPVVPSPSTVPSQLPSTEPFALPRVPTQRSAPVSAEVAEEAVAG